MTDETQPTEQPIEQPAPAPVDPASTPTLESEIKAWFTEHIRTIELDLAAIHPWTQVEGKLSALAARIREKFGRAQ